MTMMLHVPDELQDRLTAEAARRKVSVEELSLQALDNAVPPRERHTDAIALLQSWIDEGDEQEQRETGNFLIKALEDDRLSNRKLFPAELEGITW